MEQTTLTYIDRFFRILINPQQKNNQGFYSQWSYLVNLLKTQSISSDRIQAYLNILQTHDSTNKITDIKQRKVHLQHPKAQLFLLSTNNILSILQDVSDQVKRYQK